MDQAEDRHANAVGSKLRPIDRLFLYMRTYLECYDYVKFEMKRE